MFCRFLLGGLALSLVFSVAPSLIAGAEAQSATGRLARTSGPAKVQVLDKVTARVATLTLPIGRTVQYKTLSVTAEACWRSLPLEIPESVAWLHLSERAFAHAEGGEGATTETAKEERLIFSGWLYASSPSVSSVEHPVYDLVLLSCEGEETN